MIDEIKGLRELHDTLQQIPVRVEKNILRGMIRAAAKPVADDARSRAPVLKEATPDREAGALRRSVRVMSTQTKGSQVKGGVVAGTARKTRGTLRDAFYAHMVEYGTRFMSAIPFLRPAADAKVHSAIDTGAAYVRERVDAGDLKK